MIHPGIKKLATTALLSWLVMPVHAEEAPGLAPADTGLAPEMAHSTVYSSKVGMDQIPVHVAGAHIFRTILTTPSLSSQLNDTDREIIAAMPGPDDQKFQSIYKARALEGCAHLADNPETFSALAAATELNELQSFLHKLVNQEYLDIYYNQLSENTSELVLRLYRELRGTDSVHFRRVDFVSMSKEAPDYVVGKYEQMCQDFADRLQ